MKTPHPASETAACKALLKFLLFMAIIGGLLICAANVLGAATPPRPAQWSLAGLASVTQPLLASGTALPAVGSYSHGDLFRVYDVASNSLWTLTASGAWAPLGASPVPDSSASLSVHIASTTGVHGIAGGLASAAGVLAHTSDTTDPHGASMTVSDGLTIGAGNATATIGNIGSGVIQIASFAQIVAMATAPAGVPDGTITFTNSDKQLRVLASGTWEPLNNRVGWDDLRFPAIGINPAGAPTPATIDDTDGTLVFAGNADSNIAFQAQMPHSWLNESAIYPHIHVRNSADTAGSMTWILAYKMADAGDAFPANWTTATETFSIGASSATHQLFSFPAISMTGLGDSAIALFKLQRAATSQASDTYAGSVNLLEVDIHYQVEDFGSPTAGGTRP